MSDKVYLGQNVSDLDYDGKVSRISRVNLSVDIDHIYTSGGDTGRTLEAICPWGSQAMADSILAKVSGIDYQPYEASDALLDQAAEIGDGITLGGVYSVLAQSSISLDKQCAANISAPYNDEIDDEYPYKTPEQRKSERQLVYARSLITKTAEEIRLEVANELDGLSSSIDLKLDSITSTVQGINGKISTLEQTDSEIRAEITDQINGLSSSIDVKLGSITTTVQGINSKISTLEQTDEAIRGEITDQVNGLSSSIDLKLDGITLETIGADGNVSSVKLFDTGKIDLTGFVNFTGLSGGTTTIDGACIKTGEISAERINLTGSITWSDLSKSVQNEFGDGLTEDDVSTLITSELVSSPNIAGGKFKDIKQNNWIEMGQVQTNGGKTTVAYFNHYCSGYSTSNPVFVMGYTNPTTAAANWVMAPFNTIVLDYLMTNETMYVNGKWDFSGATVTGLDIEVPTDNITVVPVWG